MSLHNIYSFYNALFISCNFSPSVISNNIISSNIYIEMLFWMLVLIFFKSNLLTNIHLYFVDFFFLIGLEDSQTPKLANSLYRNPIPRITIIPKYVQNVYTKFNNNNLFQSRHISP